MVEKLPREYKVSDYKSLEWCIIIFFSKEMGKCVKVMKCDFPLYRD